MNNKKRVTELYDQVAKKKKAEVELEELLIQEEELSIKVEGLKERKKIEQTDVDRLEGRSLAAFFYNVIGKKEEQLEKEKREAYEAAVKYDTVLAEYELIKKGIDLRRTIISDLEFCERDYKKAVAEELELLKKNDVSQAKDILRIEEEINTICNQNKECDEAILAGEKALNKAYEVQNSLNSADGWNTWDILGGGGIITHVAKYNHLDDAQNAIEELQVQLREFKTELTDVKVSADIKIEIDGFTKFADWFFDNLFTDWSVGNRISDASEKVDETIHKIGQIINELDEMKQENMHRIEQLQASIAGKVLL